jgi:O-antigen/teichoic acid export membrane protein
MFKKFFSGELGRGSLILLITINIFNFLNYLFHFVMGRMLIPADYGVVAVLMSLAGVYGIPTEAIQSLISSYTSKFNTKKELEKINFLIRKSSKKALRVSIFLFLVATVVSIFISKFLNINFWLLFIVNFLIFYSFFSPIIKGVLQGRKKFGFLGGSMIIEASLKLFFAFSFVILGWKIFGAVGGVVLGFFSGFIISVYFNRDILSKKEEKISFKGIYPKSFPYFMVMIVILLVFSLDIILAKRFFSPEIAGKYSVISMLGKIIFFSTAAIGKAMFPLTCEKNGKKKEAFRLFIKSFFGVLGVSIVINIIFLIFPKMIINLLYGSQYLDMAPLLIYSGVSLSFLALSNLVLIFGLSQERIKFSGFMIIFIVFEIIMFSIFHGSVKEYLLAFMVSNIIMFIGSIFFLKRD